MWKQFLATAFSEIEKGGEFAATLRCSIATWREILFEMELEPESKMVWTATWEPCSLPWGSVELESPSGTLVKTKLVSA